MAREPHDAPPQRKLKKREIERLRRERRKVLVAGGAVLLVAGAFVLAVFLTPPPTPPHPTNPGEITAYTPMHIHPRLRILVDGIERQLPSNIGLTGGIWTSHDLDHWLDTREGQQGTLSPLHTHDASGKIHVEASVTRGFTLGEFFEVWGQPLGPDQTWNLRADGSHALSLRVDNQPSNDWGNVVFHDNQDITISYSTV